MAPASVCWPPLPAARVPRVGILRFALGAASSSSSRPKLLSESACVSSASLRLVSRAAGMGWLSISGPADSKVTSHQCPLMPAAGRGRFEEGPRADECSRPMLHQWMMLRAAGMGRHEEADKCGRSADEEICLSRQQGRCGYQHVSRTSRAASCAGLISGVMGRSRPQACL